MKKRALFISSRPIWPTTDGSRIRTAQQLGFLARRYAVDVVYLDDRGGESGDMTGQYPTSAGNVFRFRMPRWKSYLCALGFLFNRLPVQVNYYYDRPMARFIRERLAEYDFVFCNNIRTAEYVRGENIKKYIDFVDAISMNYRKARKVARGIKKLIYIIDHKRCRRYEQRVLREFDGCAVISGVDSNYLSQGNGHLHVVGNKVDIPPASSVSKHERSDILLFVGKMDYEPNVVAVTRFADRVFPELRATPPRPYLKFVIVGVQPDARVLRLAESDGITVTGYVESVEPFYRQATILVAPMLTGAGIQNKIIQAMSYGCCVVTTPIGAEGLDIKHGEIAIVEGEKAMTETISSLLGDRDRRRSMGEAARRYAVNNLSEKVIEKQFRAFVTE